jgi:hypothetical protein
VERGKYLTYVRLRALHSASRRADLFKLSGKAYWQETNPKQSRVASISTQRRRADTFWLKFFSNYRHVLKVQIYQSQLRLEVQSRIGIVLKLRERYTITVCIRACFKLEPSSFMKHRHRELHSQTTAETHQRHGHEP